MRLYEVTEEPRYLAAADYFVEQRGAQPHYYDQEYEKRGQHRTGTPTARRGSKASLRQGACPLRDSKPPSVTRYVLPT